MELPVRRAVSFCLGRADRRGGREPISLGVLFVCIILGWIHSATAEGTNFFTIVKSSSWLQTNASVTPSWFTLESAVQSDDLPWAASQVLLRHPDGETNIFVHGFRLEEWSLLRAYNSAESLRSAFPGGTYSLIASNSVTTSYSFSFPDQDDYPNSPQILNYLEGQSITPAQDYLLSWVPFVNGTSNDFIQVTIWDFGGEGAVVFDTGKVVSDSRLDGTRTSLVLPAKLFHPGERFGGLLSFGRIISRETNAAVNGVAVVGFLSSTTFDLFSSGDPVRPTLTIGPVNGGMLVQFNCEPGRGYIVEASSDLEQWNPYRYVRSDTNAANFTDADLFPGFLRGFYRLRVR